MRSRLLLLVRCYDGAGIFEVPTSEDMPTLLVAVSTIPEKLLMTMEELLVSENASGVLRFDHVATDPQADFCLGKQGM